MLFIATSYHEKDFSFCHVFRNVIIRNGCHFAVWIRPKKNMFVSCNPTDRVKIVPTRNFFSRILKIGDWPISGNAKSVSV